MSIGISAEHGELAATAQRFVDRVVGPAGRRVGLDDQAGDEQARGTETRSPVGVWGEMVAMGWPALTVPEGLGGQGFSLADLVVVVEAAGRGAVPGPLLGSALAATLVSEADGDEDAPGGELLRRLADGVPAAVAFSSSTVPIRPDGRLSGRWAPVMGASEAEVFVLPVTVEGRDGWAAVERSAVTIEDEGGVDLTRPVATVVVEDPVPVDFLDISPARGRDLATVLLCAEAVGLASWCVETAAAHGRERVQFGRPIGQFQGVKHRCADMLASLELARAATWDAARGGDPDETRLAVQCAAAVVPEAVVGIAKDCVQVLGGIGFTWEHDAHLYLRRALATRALLPRADASRRTVTELVRSGVVRRLPVELPVEAEAARPAVQQWLEELRARPSSEWSTTIADSGYLTPHWPEPWGRGASAVEQIVIDQEFRAAGVRRPHLQVAAWALPTLIAHGTAAQQERWVGPSLRQEIMWCQLFSEPEAGSDLASLRMRAERDGDGWRLTGQKVWTSMAHTADWGICLARTSPEKPHHDGITCFFVDMGSTGIEVRPLREINGDAWFNEVFFDQVFVPDDCVIGAVDDGWRAGRTTLANERVSMGSGASIGAGVTALVELLDEESSDHELARVGELLAREAALTALRKRMTIRSLAGADAGPEASVVKLLGVIHDQDVQEAGVEICGAAAASADPVAAGWVRAFLWNRSLTIAGGTSEIQRNVIGERLLGLPRDP